MGVRLRRFVRRVLFGTGVLFVGVALVAMTANQFRVAYFRKQELTTLHRVRLERGVVRYVWAASTPSVVQPSPVLTPARGGSSLFDGWDMLVVSRYLPKDAAFGPYEWWPRHTDDGSAWSISVPWWMLGAAGGVMMCAGYWGIRTPRGLCRKCEYDLRGLPAGAGVCPECGATLPAGRGA